VVQVHGSEQYRREAIVRLLLKSVGEMLLPALCVHAIAVLQWRAKGGLGPLRALLEDLDLS
jgi:hypothetical protein